MGDPSQLFSGRFTIISAVGRGGTAVVHKALDHTSETIVALKVFHAEGRDSAVVNEIWHRECTALSQLIHPNIVRLVAAGRDPSSDKRWIALEWLDGRTLENHLRDKGAVGWDAFQRNYGEAILSAIEFAAERNVTHRDLSTGNIFVSPSGEVKIIDFGQAKVASVGIGITVKDWRTIPYCPPEDDSGRYTHTRDPFSYCAIIVRALCGRILANHDELYEEAQRIELPELKRTQISRALSRSPEARFPSVIEFCSALRSTGESAGHQDDQLVVVRFAPGTLDRIWNENAEGDPAWTPEEHVVSELNEMSTVSLASGKEANAEEHFRIETRSYRLHVVIDSNNSEHLVVTNIIRKRLKIDNLYHPDRWAPAAKYTSKLPRSVAERQRASTGTSWFLDGIEAHLDERAQLARHDPHAVVESWENLLEALRFIAKTSIPSLRYKSIEKIGRRLVAELVNPEGATEEEWRVISSGGARVFRGEVESIRNGKCTLVSANEHFDIDRIPASGELENDWGQTRKALDRQARAVEQFKMNSTPSHALAEILLGKQTGPNEPSFSIVSTFFDSGLDDAKKAVVSRFMAGTELLVTHGPPGTGKTKLIVELIRQAVSANPDCKILLASQTHVALDNALERLLAADTAISCVRIGSGTKEADARVAASSLEQRSAELRANVTRSSYAFIEARASSQGIDRGEVELGLSVLEIISTTTELDSAESSRYQLEKEILEIESSRANAPPESTSQQSAQTIRIQVLNDAFDRSTSDIVLLKAELDTVKRRLTALSKEGASLASLSLDELREWSDVLLHDEKRKSLGELMRLSELWKLRFGQSDDFKSAIIASSSVVAGTCVGFCREEAALRTTFDVCIIDEAGKATTTELLVPLAQSRRAVILGDHLQLPAVLDHAIRSPGLMRRYGLTSQQIEEQLFEKLITDLADGCKANLDVQYRMRGDIGRLVSDCFYSGTLREDDSLSKRAIPDLSSAGIEKAVTWLDPYVGRFRGWEESQRGTSFENAREVRAAIEQLRRLSICFERSLPGKKWPTIGVISGYAPQVASIQHEIRRDPALDRLNVDCSSVHSFQGREVDICIYSVTRKNSRGRIGMLKEWKHLNVALSRARDFLIIVGSRDFCRSLEHVSKFGQVLEFVENSPFSEAREWSGD